MRLALALLMTLSTAAAAQVPPPPALPGQVDLSRRLVAAIEGKDLATYASLLADDVQVIDDGKVVASSKREWLERFGKKLTADGVEFELQAEYSSTGRLLFIEYFNSMGSWGRVPPPHCCWSYDAVAYDVRDGHIVRIQRLTGGDVVLGESGLPAKR